MSSVILGTDIESGEDVWIDDIARRSGSYFLGRSGMGKSSMAVNVALQDIANGHGVFFLDPHGDALRDLLRRGEYSSLQKLGIRFDLEDEEYSFGINLLQCENVASRRARMSTYTKAYNVFYKLWEEQWGVWLQLIMQNVLWAFIENQDYTLADVPMFLNPENKEFRNHIISNIKYNSPVADFWRFEMFQRREPNQQERVDAALTRINTLLTHPDVRDIVGQQKTTLNFEMFLTLPNILLFKLSSNIAEDVKKFIGTILLSELVHAVRNRPEREREQFCIFIDEFHNFASSDHMVTLSTEGRKFGVAPTYMHVERFGQLAHNQKLMGATSAIVNKVFYQTTVQDGDEFAPEFAKRVEATEIRREAELVLSPNPVEDIWDRGHPHEDIMWLRGRFFWIVELLRNQPNEKYFVFDPSWSSPEFRRKNPLTFSVKDYPDWQYYCSSADKIRQAISLWNQYLFDWMRGKYDPNEAITDEQVEITIKMIECLGGVFGFLPTLRPNIPNEKGKRLVYLMNEKQKRDHEQNTQQQIQAARNEIQHFNERSKHVEISEGEYKNLQNSRNKYGQYMNEQEIITALLKKRGLDPERKEGIWNQIQTLERSQPYQYASLPKSIALCNDINNLKEIAIQAGMPTHEVEEFIEWELNPFTSEEKDALANYIKFEARLENDLLKHDNDAYNKTMGENKKRVDGFFDATRNRRFICDLSSETRHIRTSWQNIELNAFVDLFLCDEPRKLANDPIKIPSGKYVETLRVERTQQDLNNEMANDLSTLPRFQAYAKIIQETDGRQTVATHRIEAKKLPPERETDIETVVTQAGYEYCKKRDDIDAEIRERQRRWQRGSEPPDSKRRLD